MGIGSRVRYDDHYGFVVAETVGSKHPIVRWDNGNKTEFLWCLLQESEDDV